MILSLLLFAAADAAVPKPGVVKTFGDWAVACDNVRRCEMTSLIPEEQASDGSDSGGYVSATREAGTCAAASLLDRVRRQWRR